MSANGWKWLAFRKERETQRTVDCSARVRKEFQLRVALGELHLYHEQDVVVTCDMDAQSWQSCVTL
jgi:hypothetical protein